MAGLFGGSRRRGAIGLFGRAPGVAEEEQRRLADLSLLASRLGGSLQSQDLQGVSPREPYAGNLMPTAQLPVPHRDIVRGAGGLPFEPGFAGDRHVAALPGAAGGGPARSPIGRLRAQAEGYADQIAQRGTREWGSAVSDFVMQGPLSSSGDGFGRDEGPTGSGFWGAAEGDGLGFGIEPGLFQSRGVGPEKEAPSLRPAALLWEGEDRPTQFMRPVAFQDNFDRAQHRAIARQRAEEQARRTGGSADEINKVLRGGPDPGPTQLTPSGLDTWTVQFGRRTYSKQLPAGATDAQVRAAFAGEYRQAGSEAGRAAVQRPTPKQPEHAARVPSAAPPAGDSRNRSDRGEGVGAGVGLASRTAAVGIGSERARTIYKQRVHGLEESDNAAREAAKAYIRAATPREVRAVIEAERRDLGPPPGSGGRANVTNPRVDQAAKNLGRVGRGAGVIGIGLAATDIATSNDPLRATAANVAAGVGGVVGGAGGGALGTLGGPAALVTVPAGGITGSIAGGNAGYRIGERVYDWLTGK